MAILILELETIIPPGLRGQLKLIVEVNKYMPRVHGEGAAIHISEIDAIVENHVPLIELPIRTAVAEDIAISQIIASLVPDGACLQMGSAHYRSSSVMRSRNIMIWGPYRGAESGVGKFDSTRRRYQSA